MNAIKPRRIIVCGGRNYHESQRVKETLELYVRENDIVITGGARGADELAYQWAIESQHKWRVFHANWEDEGKSAGPRRNQRMLDAGADFVIAFPGGRGTTHMVSIARNAGVPVVEVSE